MNDFIKIDTYFGLLVEGEFELSITFDTQFNIFVECTYRSSLM